MPCVRTERSREALGEGRGGNPGSGVASLARDSQLTREEEQKRKRLRGGRRGNLRRLGTVGSEWGYKAWRGIDGGSLYGVSQVDGVGAALGGHDCVASKQGGDVHGVNDRGIEAQFLELTENAVNLRVSVASFHRRVRRLCDHRFPAIMASLGRHQASHSGGGAACGGDDAIWWLELVARDDASKSLLEHNHGESFQFLYYRESLPGPCAAVCRK